MSIVDARGREVRRATIEHNAAGLRELLELLSRAGAREVAIERPDGPVVDTLLEAGITVVVISPNQLKNLRGRYGSAGNKDDRFDAFVLADTLRTDRSRLRPLLPDTPATATLRRTCRPPQRPRRPPGCVGQSAARAPARRLSGCGRVVR
ncbi:transposase [Mycobacterium tuberculosis]